MEIRRADMAADRARMIALSVEYLTWVADETGRAGTRTLYLDSAPFMAPAHQLYRAHGFVDRPPYAETEVPEPLRSRWLFMERTT